MQREMAGLEGENDVVVGTVLPRLAVYVVQQCTWCSSERGAAV